MSVNAADHGSESGLLAVPFFMYTDFELDQQWLAGCHGYHGVRTGVRMQNTAEVGAVKVLRRHPMRVHDPSRAVLFFVPVLTYVSKWITGRCANTTSHRERMAIAAAALQRASHWQRFRGRDHFFVSTTWSTAKMSFRAQMYELAQPLACATAGRYKQFCPHACSRRSSALASCTIHAPYAINPHTTSHYQSERRRSVMISFSGSLDVCCSGTSIRCRLGDYLLASADMADVVIRPSMPHNHSLKAGGCTESALAKLGRLLLERARNESNLQPLTNPKWGGSESANLSLGGPSGALSGGAHASEVSDVARARRLALAHVASRSRTAILKADTSAPGVGLVLRHARRRLAATEAWREASVGDEAVASDAKLMANSVFCFTPAGDTCVQGRFYSAVAAGCIPVVACKGAPHPVAFDHLLRYEPFWIPVTVGEWDRPAQLIDRLRKMSAEDVRRYQQALARHRPDILYDLPNSRVGGNLLNELLRTCYSPSALADFDARGICNASTPERVDASNAHPTPRAHPSSWPPAALVDLGSRVKDPLSSKARSEAEPTKAHRV